MKKVNIVFAHPLYGNSHEIYKAFQRKKDVNIIPLINEDNKVSSNLISKIRYKLKIPVDNFNINKKLKDFNFNNIDILFIIKGNEIKPYILKEIKQKFPSLKIINWSQDDMYAWHNRSLYYTLGIKYYDLIVTQKSYNIKELLSLGAKKVLFQNKAFSKGIHFPQVCSKKFSHDVVFVGYPEKERNEYMKYLADDGIIIHIYGYPNAWKKLKYKIEHKNIIIHDKSLEGIDYASALSCAKISLCFLRKINRDLQTSRSIEIPACGGFMIAERTDEHKKLFEEDKEAVYFDTKEELLEKVKYYLEHEEERKQIAKAGYDRTRNSDYSYDNRVKEILRKINEF